jgi:hypothetical protein
MPIAKQPGKVDLLLPFSEGDLSHLRRGEGNLPKKLADNGILEIDGHRVHAQPGTQRLGDAETSSAGVSPASFAAVPGRRTRAIREVFDQRAERAGASESLGRGEGFLQGCINWCSDGGLSFFTLWKWMEAVPRCTLSPGWIQFAIAPKLRLPLRCEVMWLQPASFQWRKLSAQGRLFAMTRGSRMEKPV